MDENLEKKYRQIKNLSQYKGKTEEEKIEIAKKLLEEEEILDSLTFAATDSEKGFAKDLLDKFLSQGSITTESDKDDLRQLINQELIAERLNNLLKNQASTANPAQDLWSVDRLDKVIERIRELKEKLGLTSKDKNESNFLETWEILKKKALHYYETHKGCNVVKCPYCSKLFYLLMRTEELTVEKCNWFRGTVLYNKPLMKLIENKILTPEQAAEIMGVHVLYIQKIYDNIYLKEQSDDRKD